MRNGFCCSSLLLLVATVTGCASAPSEEIAGYVCDSGRTVTVTYRGPDIAVLQMGPRQIEMTSATSPIGARYVGRELQWVTEMRGDDRIGTLFTRGNDGEPGQIAERCRETERD